VCGSQLVAGIGLTLAFGWLVPGIDNWAHLGGLAGGRSRKCVAETSNPCAVSQNDVFWSRTYQACQ